jgi:hypothetical protein
MTRGIVLLPPVPFAENDDVFPVLAGIAVVHGVRNGLDETSVRVVRAKGHLFTTKSH